MSIIHSSIHHPPAHRVVHTHSRAVHAARGGAGPGGGAGPRAAAPPGARAPLCCGRRCCQRGRGGGDDDDDDRLLLHDEGVEETEGGAMHPRAEELLQAHLAKADHAGYQRMQVGAVGAATGS